jgi:hypothetical protein
MGPADANSLADTIAKALIAATPELNPTFRSWRMIPPNPTPEALEEIENEMIEWERATSTRWDAAETIWGIVYKHGTDLPEK